MGAREYEKYEEGFREGYALGYQAGVAQAIDRVPVSSMERNYSPRPRSQEPRPKRKLSAWNKFVKANSKKPRFKYKSGANKGKLNLKAMAVAFRRTPAGKKSKK